MTAAADRHLLFGLLALQNGIINQGQLVAAFQAWTLDKSRSLADHLEARGDLTLAKRCFLIRVRKIVGSPVRWVSQFPSNVTQSATASAEEPLVCRHPPTS